MQKFCDLAEPQNFLPQTLSSFNPLSAKPTKWSNTLKQFVGKLTTNCLSVFDHFVGLALKGLKPLHLLISFVSWCSLVYLIRSKVFDKKENIREQLSNILDKINDNNFFKKLIM